MILEIGAGAAQTLVTGQRDGPARPHVLLLVGQDEEDVVATVVRAGCVGGGERRFDAAGDAGRLGDRGVGDDGRTGNRGAGLEELSARRNTFTHDKRSP
jgi:hypothetical protein